MVKRRGLIHGSLALDCFRTSTYHGKSAHAAGEPWNSINAVNGVQLAIHAMDMLRQQVRPESRWARGLMRRYRVQRHSCLW